MIGLFYRTTGLCEPDPGPKSFLLMCHLDEEEKEDTGKEGEEEFSTPWVANEKTQSHWGPIKEDS